MTLDTQPPAATPASTATVADILRGHLAATGQSMRALSLSAGLNAKAVGDILAGRTQRPLATALQALSLVVGHDLTAIPMTRAATAPHVLAMLAQTPPDGWSEAALRGAKSALTFYERRGGRGATGGSPTFDRASVRTFLASNSPASLGVSQATLSAYASHWRALLDLIGGGGRAAQIRDVTGKWRWLYDAVAGLGLKKDLTFAGGPFFAWCDSRGLEIGDVTAATFVEYRSHRVAQGRVTVGDAKDTKTAKRARDLWNHVAALPEFAQRGVRAVEQPFTDGRVRYATPEELVAPLLAEFDNGVVPWVMGKTTPAGRPVDEILDEIEAAAAPALSDKIARARRFNGGQAENRRAEREDRLRAQGVLLDGRTWGPKRLKVARAGIISLVKSYYATTDTLIETIEDLTEPEQLEAAARALDEATDVEGLGSSYVASLLKLVRKIAIGYVGVSADAAARISAVIKKFTPDRAGISPRNMLKLQQFTPERLDSFFAMSGVMVGEINKELARRREANRRAVAAGRKPVDLVDAEIARKLELVVAHDVFCARAPRRDNVLRIDLARHVRDAADGTVVIELPPEMVKGGKKLTIPLSARRSAVFRQHVEKARPLLLTDANKDSTMLFPARKCDDGYYTCLTVQLMREIHKRVGVKFHPHLYRHLVGWVWLKEDPGKLGQVQLLLGHKDIKTTLNFYIELDETLALQQWSDYLEERDNGDRKPRRALAA